MGFLQNLANSSPDRAMQLENQMRQLEIDKTKKAMNPTRLVSKPQVSEGVLRQIFGTAPVGPLPENQSNVMDYITGSSQDFALPKDATPTVDEYTKYAQGQNYMADAKKSASALNSGNSKLDEFLSPTESAALGVAYGTKKKDAVGKIPKEKPNNNDNNNAFKLADDYTKASGDFPKMRDAYNRIIASAKDPSAAGDLALIFNYMKMLDPGSTVREGEFANAESAGGVPDRIVATYNKILNGERLSAPIRLDFIDRSGRIYKSAASQQAMTDQQFKNSAKLFGVDPNKVVREQGTYLQNSDQGGGLTPEEQAEFQRLELKYGGK